jgi:diacylglycerol kinase family enzyme
VGILSPTFCKATANLKFFCVINNRSGPTGEPCRDDVARFFAERSISVKIVELDQNKSPKAVAEDAIRQKYDVIVAAGGDGTINAVASALVGNSAVKLGVIPRGTLNHFAQALEIPNDLEKAVEIIIAGHVKSIDVGQINDSIFLNNSSVGLYPAIVRMREALQNSGLSKWPAAFWAAFRIFWRFQRLSLELVSSIADASQHDTSMLFVGNNLYEMSFPTLGSRPTLESGKLWIMMPKSATRLGLIGTFLKMILGRETADDAVTMEATTLIVRSKRRFLKVAIDGEVIQLQSPLKYRSRPKSLQVIVPALQKLKA